MKILTYSITIDKPCGFVYKTILDKSVYPDWAKAWGPGMTYEGVWEVGEHVSFFDNTQGGTKVIIEDMKPNEYIKVKHITMVNPQNIEVELADEMMKKWIGSREEYHFKDSGDSKTTLEIIMHTDEAFQAMFDGTWPKALKLFKEVCEKQ